MGILDSLGVSREVRAQRALQNGTRAYEDFEEAIRASGRDVSRFVNASKNWAKAIKECGGYKDTAAFREFRRQHKKYYWAFPLPDDELLESHESIQGVIREEFCKWFSASGEPGSVDTESLPKAWGRTWRRVLDKLREQELVDNSNRLHYDLNLFVPSIGKLIGELIAKYSADPSTKRYCAGQFFGELSSYTEILIIKKNARIEDLSLPDQPWRGIFEDLLGLLRLPGT